MHRLNLCVGCPKCVLSLFSRVQVYREFLNCVLPIFIFFVLHLLAFNVAVCLFFVW